jgi:hypothetical protein
MDRRGPIFWLAAALGAAAIACGVVVALPSGGFVARGLVAGVFALAGMTKLRDPAPLLRVLRDSGSAHPNRPRITPAHVRGLALAELATAGALLVPAAATAGAVAALALLVVLTAGAIAVLHRAPDADCGCFGDRAPRVGAPPVRNGVLAGLAGGLLAIGPAAAAPSARWIAAVGLAALLSLAGLPRPGDRARAAHATQNTTPDVPHLWSRRRWIRAGVAGAAGTALTVLEAGPAAANITNESATVEPESCTNCRCCANVFFLGIFFCTRYCCTGCVGVSGGGLVQTPSGAAHASFFGNTVTVKHSTQSVTLGALSWFDPSWPGGGLSLQSAQITSYRRVPGTPVRELVGLASANGKGKHHFVLRVTDQGAPGSGRDTVELTVAGVAAGGAGGSGATYAASGELSQGDATVSLQGAAINLKPSKPHAHG